MAATIEFEGFTDQRLEEFRRWQGVSYGVLSEVRDRLRPGITERRATVWAMQGFRREGADRYFHLPVALFGERTALPEPWSTPSFWPTDRALADGDAVILDASPIFDGHVVDTSMSFTVGATTDAGHAAMKGDDLTYRGTILDAVRAGATFREIAHTVDADLTARGYRNCHQLHPEAVLGHRMLHVAADLGGGTASDGSGFDTDVLRWFGRGIRAAVESGAPSPTWSDLPTSDHRPPPGLWAVEPHLAKDGIGVKWEEILVVEDNDAYWLSDDVPHLPRSTSA
ncbi:MAG TPA: M24 family metallopeptidase [Acidimicrobiales bacterium]|nr:M24 family metallopeptidase [Acidimicrobiales bacterium]